MFRSPSTEPENKHEMETEETRLPTHKTTVRDKCCQTDHVCCEKDPTVEPGDPPLLQRPVHTSKSGILQIIECFRSGTKQLRLMLLKEVDTIFECKLCRSLFRGLPNLITHKQFYCLSNLLVDENPPDENNKPSPSAKDLLETVYPKPNKPEFVIQLESIQTNHNAVFQIVKPISEVNLEQNTPDQADPQQEETASTPPSSLTPEAPVVAPSVTDNVNKEPISTIPNADSKDFSTPVPKAAKRRYNSNPFLCKLCKKDFNCRRSIRRHIKKVHKKKLEEIKKFIEVKRNIPLSAAKGHANVFHGVIGKSCHICHKSFATKANTRRHIDEVHRGMRRDSITTETSTKSSKSVAPETVASKKTPLNAISQVQKSPAKSDFGLSSFTCPICNRQYTSKYLLKKHAQIVHKTALSFRLNKGYNKTSTLENKVKVEETNAIDSSTNSGAASSPSESKGANHSNEKKSTSTPKSRTKPDGESPKSSNSPVDKKKYKKSKLSAGFDFKQLYCKLCKRQFTSKQNLAKHIELHTDGNCIFVKFYKCPLCSYETRRKRDVIRHITVVHKKSQRALSKITANLESRAIKKPIESLLEKTSKRGPKQDKCKRVSPRQDRCSPVSKKCDGSDIGIEVKVTKNFSLLKCNLCGKAFAKKKDLEQHKKNHKANSNTTVELKIKGRYTRSKAPIS